METTLAVEKHGIWQVRWKWTQSDLTSPYLIIHLLSSFHTDTHNAGSMWKQHWRYRSTAFGKCFASEHSQTRLLSILSLIYYLHFTQTLTTLDLRENRISDRGAQHLASALEVNTVRLDFLPFHHSSTIFIWHRHSRHWIWKRTISGAEGQTFWQMLCEWTQSDSTSLHFITYLLSSSQIDT